MYSRLCLRQTLVLLLVDHAMLFQSPLVDSDCLLHLSLVDNGLDRSPLSLPLCVANRPSSARSSVFKCMSSPATFCDSSYWPFSWMRICVCPSLSRLRSGLYPERLRPILDASLHWVCPLGIRIRRANRLSLWSCDFVNILDVRDLGLCRVRLHWPASRCILFSYARERFSISVRLYFEWISDGLMFCVMTWDFSDFELGIRASFDLMKFV